MQTKHIHHGKGLTLTITFQQTLEAIKERTPCSPASLRRYIKKLKIKPLGLLPTKPQRFPPETPGRILGALGLTAPQPVPGKRMEFLNAPAGIVSLRQLKSVRAAAKKARAV
jgi:hypothetical protein